MWLECDITKLHAWMLMVVDLKYIWLCSLSFYMISSEQGETGLMIWAKWAVGVDTLLDLIATSYSIRQELKHRTIVLCSFAAYWDLASGQYWNKRGIRVSASTCIFFGSSWCFWVLRTAPRVDTGGASTLVIGAANSTHYATGQLFIWVLQGATPLRVAPWMLKSSKARWCLGMLGCYSGSCVST